MADQTGNRCSKGHIMDSTWDRCYFCENESKASANNSGSGPESRRSSGRETWIMTDATPADEPPPSRVYAGAGETRQIVGFLITYSRPSMPWGYSYPVRLGKNYIGADRVGSAPDDPDCDVKVSEDQEMSACHALILCREDRVANAVRFDLIDQQSSCGTYLNNELIPLQGVTLPNYAEIKTGGTQWIFIKIRP